MAERDTIILGGIVDKDGNSYRTIVSEELVKLMEVGGVELESSTQDNAYIYGISNGVLYKINKETMGIEGTFSPVYQNSRTFNPIASDTDYIYVQGGLVGNIVEKVRKSDMKRVATSAPYGGYITYISVDNSYIYIGGNTTYKVFKLNKSDLSKDSESPSYGGVINVVLTDDEYIYISAGTTKVLYKLNKSDLVEVAQSAELEGKITTLAIDESFIYTGESSKNIIRKLDKTNLVEVGSVVPNNQTIQALFLSNNNLYVGQFLTNRIFIYDKNTLLLKGATSAIYDTSSHMETIIADDNYVFCSGSSPSSVIKLGYTYQIQAYERVTLS